MFWMNFMPGLEI